MRSRLENEPTACWRMKKLPSITNELSNSSLHSQSQASVERSCSQWDTLWHVPENLNAHVQRSHRQRQLPASCEPKGSHDQLHYSWRGRLWAFLVMAISQLALISLWSI